MHLPKYKIFSIFDTIPTSVIKFVQRAIPSAAKTQICVETDPFTQRCALQPITHDAVELMNAMNNQRRSDESSLKYWCFLY